jgi:hypothetical protein
VAWRADPVLREIPFILTTAGLLPKDVQPPYDLFFRKPVPFDTLLAEIRQLIAPRG